MKGIKITYREVKLRQIQDFRTYPKGNLYNIYRHFSTPFTYLFVRLGVSPNAITILYFFSCILGAIFLARGTYLSLVIGISFFILFKILDDSDGEVARIQNSHSMEGVYLDRIGHYIFNLCLGIGLGFGMYKLYHNEVYIILGFFYIFALVLEHSIIDLLISMLRQKLIAHSFGKRVLKRHAHEIEMMNIFKKDSSFKKQTILSKIFSIYPSQGLLFSDHIPTTILTFLIVAEYFLNFYFNFKLMFFTLVSGLIPLYLFILSAWKLMWVIIFIFNLEKKRFITGFLSVK